MSQRKVFEPICSFDHSSDRFRSSIRIARWCPVSMSEDPDVVFQEDVTPPGNHYFHDQLVFGGEPQQRGSVAEAQQGELEQLVRGAVQRIGPGTSALSYTLPADSRWGRAYNRQT